MIEINRAQLDMLAQWFQPEAPGPVIGPHVIRTGFGRAWVDRWPEVQTVIVETNYNYVLVGDPATVNPQELSNTVAGIVSAPECFLPLLEAAFPTLIKWPRRIGMLPHAPIQPPPSNAELRRFWLDDADDLDNLSAEAIWVSQTWGGGKALAQSGYGWGAWVNGILASVACTFFLGDRYEDIGVVTEAGYRATGLSTACAYELCLDVMARGRKPSWSTSTDNTGSWRVAEKLGFVHHRNDWLYIVGRELPKSGS
jgi:RimJ/RimL family protein N-acetyltransferase